MSELCDLLLEFGAYQAINLDGGGSTTLVAQNADGTAQVLNSPIHARIPGRERPIANQLGIYAPR
ncbi:MAG: phosphodiester glycosidase family protein, partial [Chloroflexota bacterium]